MARGKLQAGQLANALGVNPVTVSKWRSGAFEPDVPKIEAIAKCLQGVGVTDATAAWLRFGTVVELARHTGAAVWPPGWQARTHQLAVEAANRGATEEEIAVVRGWMTDPQLQALWAGGAPKDLTELDGIEVGARAWLRARGRMVKKG